MNERHDSPPKVKLLRLLTPTERDVAVYLTRGIRTKAIAQLMSVQPGTIKVHIKSIYAKCGLSGVNANGWDGCILLTRAAMNGELDLGGPALGEGIIVIGEMTL